MLARFRAFLVDVLIVSVILLGIVTIWREYRRAKVVLVDPIRLPLQLEAEGFKGDVLAAELIDEFTGLQRAAGPEWYDRWQTRELIREADLPDLEIPGAELSVRAALRFVREAFGNGDVRIRGEIVTLDPPAGSRKRGCGMNLLLTSGPRLFVAAEGLDACGAKTRAETQAALDVLLRDVALTLTERLEPCSGAMISLGRSGSEALSNAEILALRCVSNADGGSRSAAAAPVRGGFLGGSRSADPVTKWSYVILGDILHRRDDLEGAERSYRRAVELDATFAVPHIYWGTLLYAKNDLGGAVERYQKAIALDAGSRYRALALTNWGLVHYQRREMDEAIAKYREALAADVRFEFHDVIYTNLGNALLERRAGSPDELRRFAREASQAYRKSIDWNPRYAYGHHGMGRALWQLRRLEASTQAFARAAQLSPALADPVNAWGNVLRDQARPVDAIEKYQEAIRRDIEFAWAYEDWGAALAGVCSSPRPGACARCTKLAEARARAYLAWADRRAELGDELGAAERRAEAARTFRCGTATARPGPQSPTSAKVTCTAGRSPG